MSEYPTNLNANESLSKFKLLSAYGGPGSIMHTEYGSIIISCIEEWGFIQTIDKFITDSNNLDTPMNKYVYDQCRINDLKLSNDPRLLIELKKRIGLENLSFLVLIPDIDLNDNYKSIKGDKKSLAINSTFMPKGFFDKKNNYKLYYDWLTQWNNDSTFFPPKYKISKGDKTYTNLLKQDNLLLICKNGHISDFPWSKYLRWKNESPFENKIKIDLFNKLDCCNNPKIVITESSANASGFDGKWLKCNNCAQSVSLKGLMSVKIACPGHKPWEANTGNVSSYYGNKFERKNGPRIESCSLKNDVDESMKVALSTGNNLYYTKILSSIYIPDEIFKNENILIKEELERNLQNAIATKDFTNAIKINERITEINKLIENTPIEDIDDSKKDEFYRYQEFIAFTTKEDLQININDDLKVKDVSMNLSEDLKTYFSKVLRIDNLKVSSAQLNFSRVEPVDLDTANKNIKGKNIFRSKNELVQVYPVVENYGEGIFFSFNSKRLEEFKPDLFKLESNWNRERDDFAFSSSNYAQKNGWQLYLIHTFCHLMMRELEFRCGYPTASLSERIYVSSNPEFMMFGFMIYTAEGAEGSMGGLIAQTRSSNMNKLIRSALKRATVCNSDPLCWESEGQGLFDLNIASCFSCSLVSETSCELRNIYLDRRVLVDTEYGFFKDLINS